MTLPLRVRFDVIVPHDERDAQEIAGAFAEAMLKAGASEVTIVRVGPARIRVTAEPSNPEEEVPA